MERTYAGLQRPDFEREPPDCQGCRNRDAMLDELQRDRDQYMAWYALADAERRKAEAEVERLRAEVKHWRDARASAIEAGDAMQAERDALRALIADAVIDALAEPNHDYPCRSDGRCQYAIDHGAEGMGHCPKGRCALAASDALAERLRKPLTDEEIADAVQAERDTDE